VLPRCHHESRKQVFESPHRIAHCGFVIKLADFSQIGYVRLSPKPDFQSASSCYGDKWLVKRSFSRFFFRVTPSDSPRSKAVHRSILMAATTFRDRAPGFSCGRIAPSKNAGVQEFRKPQSVTQHDYKKEKSPAEPGLLTNYFFDQFILPVWRSDA
jgi:hypothetical protein